MPFSSRRSALSKVSTLYTHTHTHKNKLTHTHTNGSPAPCPGVCQVWLADWLLGVLCNYSSGQGAVFLTWQMVQRHAASGNRDNRLPARR